MTDLRELQEHWEQFANRDALWAICTDPSMRGKGWDEDAFFASGRSEISKVLAHLTNRCITVPAGGQVLDFGCGAGRLSQALAERFPVVYGIDISRTMISLANKLNRYPAVCHYVHNATDHLPFDNETFSFVYTSIVLQHVEPAFTRTYIREFLRVLATNGVLVFQLPFARRGDYLRRVRELIRLRTRIRQLLHRQLEPIMEMHCITEPEVRWIVRENCGDVADVQLTNSSDSTFARGLNYLDSPPTSGFLSNQYCVVKLGRTRCVSNAVPDRLVKGRS